MKFSYAALALLLLLVGQEASARNVATVSSTEGWSLTVTLKYTGMRMTNPQNDCKWGFNYKLDMDYKVSYSDGGGARMWYIGAGGGCFTDDGTVGIPEYQSRWGNISSPEKWSATRTKCHRVDYAEYECRTVFLTVSGPGIPEQTVAMPYLAAPAQQQILPVSLRDFTATSGPAGVLLAWWTDAESNNSHFIIQRSADGIDWHRIAEVPGHGNSATVSDYTFEDASPVIDRAFYRLVQVDRTGTQSLSTVASVTDGAGLGALEVYPNPAADRLFVSATEPIALFDLSGRDITPYVNVTATAGHAYSVDVSGLMAGVYLVRSGSRARRFVHL
ncbi:T9SS type A sorting domain-containing protein [Lewinella sp. IMCC34183]|uniref:T9SS type A sorting domain-containing protein n=1 Tax=Lewinella sp. IMCC34183 TaxID=2248762 RepID=UPI000E24CB2E|nr:T9SS type A sorting domain-containing protein [Lewinella sp. IMCC34183]